MNILVALPLLPLAAALWFALIRPGDRRAACWVVALAAFVTIATALLTNPQSLEVVHLLVRNRSALVLDDAARPALILFGGLWLAVGLLARNRPAGPAPMALLFGLSAAVTLAISRGGPLVYAAMLATGYALYGALASEASEASEADGRWRGRLMVALLVVSDLLIFEVLLHGTAHPETGMTRGLLLLVGLALLLRSGTPPAHAWLPRALSGASAPTAMLLAALPAACAAIGGRRLLGPDGLAIGPAVIGLALAGALWSAFAATRVSGARATLGYAAAATAAILLVTIPAIGQATVWTWAVVSLTACCAAVPAIGLQRDGWARNAAVTLVLASHGLAGAQAAVLATAGRAPAIGFLAALVAGAATMLLAMTLRRTDGRTGAADAAEATAVALALGGLATTGLVFLWRAGGAGFDSFWPAPAGITLGLVLLRLQHAGTPRAQRPIDRFGGARGRTVAALQEFCFSRLPRARDRLQAAVFRLWRGDAWAERTARLELLLRRWPATAVLMLLVAIAGAALLAS